MDPQTHGGSRAEAMEEMVRCGLIVYYFSQQIPVATQIPLLKTDPFTGTQSLSKSQWMDGLVSDFMAKQHLDVFSFF